MKIETTEKPKTEFSFSLVISFYFSNETIQSFCETITLSKGQRAALLKFPISLVSIMYILVSISDIDQQNQSIISEVPFSQPQSSFSPQKRANNDNRYKDIRTGTLTNSPFKTLKTQQQTFLHQKPYSGLKNPGFHCYMNSYLQTLFHIPSFRQMILQLDSKIFPPNSIVLHLQTLFHEMNQKTPIVSSFSILQSFDWSQEEKDSQHDIHEFSLYFLELIQTQICQQGLSVDFFNKFVGKFVSSINSAHHSPIITDNNFGDLSLSIKN
jgi:hypothetical protein